MKKFANRLNHVVFDVDTKNFKWIQLEELYNTDPNKTYTLLGVSKNSKSKYGTEPIAIIKGFLVNLPRHLLTDIDKILDDDEFIDYVKQGHLGFQVYAYSKDDNKGKETTYFSVKWIDL